MKLTKIIAVVLTASAILLPYAGFAAEVIVNAEVRMFKPDIVYIQPGDTVQWTNMTSHNAVTYIVQEGATGFGEKGQLPGGSFSATLEKEGIYGYVCEPHIGFGMVGVIAVGNITAEMKDAAVKTAEETLVGPFRRLIGTLKKVEVK
ncbi:MAG: blue (type 1) copper domain protein [Gammaproteobacteria bacterium]|nr:blue (type 1) copper domain protein [Gammaproteobacteria bacterium]